MNKHTQEAFKQEQAKLAVSAWTAQAQYFGGVVTLPIILESGSPNYSSQPVDQLHAQIGRLDARTLHSFAYIKNNSYPINVIPHYHAIAEAMQTTSPRVARKVEDRARALQRYLSEPEEGERSFTQIVTKRGPTRVVDVLTKRVEKLIQQHSPIAFF